MSKSDVAQKKPQSRLKTWLTNLLIVIVVTVLMLLVGESAMRWLDGYQLSTLELNQDTTIQQSE